MAKRAPVNEEPYRPLLDPGVISAALTRTTAGLPPQPRPETPPQASAKVVDLSRPEVPRAATLVRESQEPERPRPQAGEGRPAPQELVEKFDQEKRILLTRTESAALERLVISLAGRIGAQLKLSHVLRGLIGLLLNAEGEVDKRAGEAPVLVRPPNGDGKALQRFEKEIARILGAAIRDAGPIR
ncbi:MAG: hypothetical protein AB9869_03660 [Verrucomicrobiia bacterium]